MSIERHSFGETPDGQTVELFLLQSSNRMIAKIARYGGRITELHTPDRDGFSGNIVLGFDRLDPYLDDKAYLGTLVGRYANRIARGQFDLDGQTYHLPVNNGPNTLHGGTIGF